MTTIDMQTMRYINLLDKISRVRTTKCFLYNNSIIFAVPRELVSRAIGPRANNLRYIQEQIGKRIRVIEQSSGHKEAERFVADIVSPVTFKGIEIKEGIIILNAGSQSKAALIGRNKRRYDELKKIINDTYGLDLRII